jgi:hypothetical protein
MILRIKNKMTLEEKIQHIFDTIKLIEAEDDPSVAAIMMEGYGLSINLLEAVMKTRSRKNIDISEHIEIISSVLGVSVRDLVLQIVQDANNAQTESNKEADAKTLEFITSGEDLDDYEKFLAQNKAKESLDFLAKSI